MSSVGALSAEIFVIQKRPRDKIKKWKRYKNT